MRNRPQAALMEKDELELKRMYDRVNQRHSRERKKRRLEELEQTNKHLAQQLAEAREALSAVQQKEAALRSAVDNVYALLNSSTSPVINPQGIPSVTKSSAYAHAHDKQENAASGDSRSICGSFPHSDCHQHGSQPAAQTNSPIRDATSVFTEIDGNCILNLPIQFGQGAWVNLLDQHPLINGIEDNHNHPPVFPISSANEDTTIAEASEEHTDCEEWASSGQNISLTDPQINLSEHASLRNDQSPSYPISHPSQSEDIWLSLPLHLAPMTELDEVILSVTTVGRQWMRQQGRLHSELEKPSFPSVSSLLNSSDGSTGDEATNPISSAVAKYTLTTCVKSFPRKVAHHYTVGYLLRWLVSPTEENYKQLPPFLRPTFLQRTVPHPAWVDTVPW